VSARPKSSDRSRRQVGRYEIVREIGRGGMATVFLAVQLDLDRRVALKELRPQGTWDRSSARRFLAEARLAGSFSHPNIVTVHDYFEQDHVPYIAMEYLAGGSLRPYVGRLTLSQVGGVLEGLLAGLAQAERLEIVHRDIKPENALVTNEGGIKIADFGIAKAKRAFETGSQLTAVGTTLGTPNYIAPEQAMAQRLGPWTDLYSVGLMAFEMLVGRTPFGDSTEPMGIVIRQINEPLPRISDLVPSIPERISDWVGWLASKSPADRPQSAGEAWNALDGILFGLLGPLWRRNSSLVGFGQLPEAMAAPMATPEPRRPRPPTREAAAVAAAVAAAGVAGIGAAPAMAATLPPSTPIPESVPMPTGRGPHRVPTAAKAVIALAALLIAGALVLSSGKGALMQAAVETPTPTPAVSTAPPSLGPPANAALPDEAAAAQQLGVTYRRAAAQIEQQSTTDPLDKSNAPLVAALRKTARAYDTAATAAAAGDIAGYTTAMAAAESSKRELSTLLNGAPGGGLPASSAPPPASTPAVAPEPRNSCAGDSESDDPSDDACGPA
jgi:hypothetical protein